MQRKLRVSGWARRSDPVFRYVLRRSIIRRRRWVNCLLSLVGGLLLMALIAASVAAYRDDALDIFFTAAEPPLLLVAYFPLLVLQLGALAVMFSQIALVGLTPPDATLDEKRHVWEIVKVTSSGAERVTRSRWGVTLYRGGGAVACFVALRTAFMLKAALDLGDYRPLLAEATPALPHWAAEALLIGLLVELVLLPVITLSLSAALGLWLSLLLRRRWVLVLVQQVIFIALVLAAGAAVVAGWVALDGAFHLRQYACSNDVVWTLLLAMAVFGDMGMRLMSADALAYITAGVDYGALIGLPLLAVLVGEMTLTRWLLRWSAGMASRAARD